MGDLNDGPFVLATQWLADVLDRCAGGRESVELGELAPHLAEALRGVAAGLLERPESITVVEFAGPPARARRVRPGDVVAIPSASCGYYLAVMIMSNRFGVAFGFFAGKRQTARMPSRDEAVDPYPVYSDDDSVRTGRWSVVGNDAALLELFPSEPEIFHVSGVAETAAGVTRPYSDEEAEAFRPWDRYYQMFYSSEHLHKFLDLRGGRVH
ncbi:hypothetical protein ACPPVO_54450 [Dactylosporangium sp. McL0621]|uniref:hypothetical protein n=1 Tax=Dactylosporangium sp. McL0621 TaxID=3415678 RepID=UPI003CF6F925